jgi:hypothetical protein
MNDFKCTPATTCISRSGMASINPRHDDWTTAAPAIPCRPDATRHAKHAIAESQRPRRWPAGGNRVSMRDGHRARHNRLYLFSDGAFEVKRPDGTVTTFDDLLQFINRPAMDGDVTSMFCSGIFYRCAAKTRSRTIFQSFVSRSSACPGKVGTGFPIRTCVESNKLERITIRSNRDAL